MRGRAQPFAPVDRCRRARGLCLGAEKLKAKSLSKYGQYTLSPISNVNAIFGDCEAVRRTGGASACFVGRFCCARLTA